MELEIDEAADPTVVDGNVFTVLSNDIILKILGKLESDPRDWARVCCVCTRFASLVGDACCRAKCFRTLSSDLLKSPHGGWAALFKVSVCCPGLLCAGVLFKSSDFGLERDIGPDQNSLRGPPEPPRPPAGAEEGASPSDCWSLFDDLYFDTVYDNSEEALTPSAPPTENAESDLEEATESSKKRRTDGDGGSVSAHLASGAWNLSREQGAKLLAPRFRCDSLYICDWPGCVHARQRREYMVFRGLFSNFKRSRVWKTIVATNRSRIPLGCAFCSCKEIWDLHSAFCLRTVFGFHDDGEPVVRAFVCDNGHVSGAWTHRSLSA